MARTKEKREIHHKTDNRELILALASMPKWSNILLQSTDKAYQPFLEWLLTNDFLRHHPNYTSVKALSQESGFNYSKISKWLRDIYEDIFSLNFDKPELFNEEGIKHHFHVRNYDDYVNFTIWLPATPRLFEACEIRFFEPKTGTTRFWVSYVGHVIEDDETIISVWLKGGFVNRYREMLLERALYEGWLNTSDSLFKYDFEIDKELKQRYK